MSEYTERALRELAAANLRYLDAVGALSTATKRRKQSAAYAIQLGVSKVQVARLIGTSDSRVGQMVRDAG